MILRFLYADTRVMKMECHYFRLQVYAHTVGGFQVGGITCPDGTFQDLGAIFVEN